MKIDERQWLILMQKIHLELKEWVEKELSLVPKAIQRINDRTRIHIKQLIFDLEAIDKNCKVISLHRAKKESGMKLTYKVSKDGTPSFGEFREKKEKDNNKKMFM